MMGGIYIFISDIQKTSLLTSVVGFLFLESQGEVPPKASAII